MASTPLVDKTSWITAIFCTLGSKPPVVVRYGIRTSNIISGAIFSNWPGPVLIRITTRSPSKSKARPMGVWVSSIRRFRSSKFFSLEGSAGCSPESSFISPCKRSTLVPKALKDSAARKPVFV